MLNISFFIVLLVFLLAGVSCHQPAAPRRVPIESQQMADSIHIVTATQPSFRQWVQGAEPAAGHQKFVRIIVDSIFNPTAVPISVELYWHTADHTQFLGAVAPFPADHPGSFIIATGGKLTGKGQLEFRLVLPNNRNNAAQLEVIVKPLKLE